MLLVGLFLSGLISQISAQGKVMCYIDSSVLSNEQVLKELGENANCSYVIVSYASLNSTDSTISFSPSYKDGIKSLVDLRKKTIHQGGVMIQIGGNEDSENFSKMTSTPDDRMSFINAIMDFCTINQLDGVDVHWKYPQRRVPREKNNYLSFTQELRKRMINGTCNILSMVLPPRRDLITPGYNILFLNPVVDYFNLLSYDFPPPKTSARTLSGSYHQAPLSLPRTSKQFRDRSVMAITRLYLRVGVTPAKLVVGIPLFGNQYDGDAVLQPPIPVNQLCQMEVNEEWTKDEEDQSLGPVLRKGNVTISYDNIDSVNAKATMVKDFKLGGVAFWRMEMDDWDGTCPVSGKARLGNSFRWPLIRTAFDKVTPGIRLTPPKDVSVTLPPALRANFSENNRPIESTAGLNPVLPTNVNTSSNAPVAAFGYAYTPPAAPHAGSTYSANTRLPYNPPSTQRKPFTTLTSFNVHDPFTRVVEAGQDVVVEAFNLQINDNYFYDSN